MIQPWFLHPHWLAFLSLFAAVATCDVFVERGLHRRLVTAVYAASALVGLCLIAVGALAQFAAQPLFVVLALMLAGFVITASCGASLVKAHRRYDVTEMRRMAAEGL